MTEPGPFTFSLLAGFIAVLGPTLGPYALIAFAAGVGSLLAMSVEPTPTRLAGVKFVALGALIAWCITGPLVWACTRYLNVPGEIALVPVAFLLGAARSQLLAFIKLVLDGVAAAFSAVLSVRANRGRGGGQ